MNTAGNNRGSRSDKLKKIFSMTRQFLGLGGGEGSKTE
jgi:hypothetical protein